eukprot:m.151960 g.151960  ORF g.151960 m.151960 type:complete len:68 (-) comp52842_c0_seq5:451-654(-)
MRRRTSRSTSLSASIRFRAILRNLVSLSRATSEEGTSETFLTDEHLPLLPDILERGCQPVGKIYNLY